MYQNVQFQNNPYDQLYHEAEVLAAVDHFIQEVCLGSYDLYHQNFIVNGNLKLTPFTLKTAK